MSSVIGSYIFKVVFATCAKVAEHEIACDTERFAPLKDAQVGGARMASVIGFDVFFGFTEML